MVAIGSWQQQDSDVVIRSQIVYRTVVIIGRPIPEAESVESMKAAKERYWTVWDDTGRYAALPEFKDWGYLATLIRCDREYFDGKKQTDGIQPCAPQSQR